MFGTIGLPVGELNVLPSEGTKLLSEGIRLTSGTTMLQIMVMKDRMGSLPNLSIPPLRSWIPVRDQLTIPRRPPMTSAACLRMS
jgi:hypothetical protein